MKRFEGRTAALMLAGVVLAAVPCRAGHVGYGRFGYGPFDFNTGFAALTHSMAGCSLLFPQPAEARARPDTDSRPEEEEA